MEHRRTGHQNQVVCVGEDGKKFGELSLEIDCLARSFTGQLAVARGVRME